MTVSDNTLAAEILGDLFELLGDKKSQCIEKMAKNVSENPRIDLKIAGNLGSAAASRSRKAAS